MFRRGWVFKDDKLLMFEEDSVLVLRGWSACRAWWKTETTGWTATRPQGTLIRDIWSTSRPRYVERWKDEPDEQRRIGLRLRSEAARRFIALFPPEVLRVVKPYPERQWHVLSLVARCPGALDLARDNPALAFALASSWVFRPRRVKQPMRAARALVGRKRTAILEALGFPASAAVARVLAKIPRRAVSVQSLLYLRATLLAPDPPKALHHLPRLDAGVLRILCDPALFALSTWSLLEEVARERPSTQRAAYLLRDTAAMHQTVLGTPLGPQRSLARLERLHDELAGEFQIGCCRFEAPTELPPPPLPAGPGIEPLRRAADIIEEGRTMRHCVGSYLGRVATGAVYIYRITEPERATLSVRFTPHGWKVDQLSAPANAPVSYATLQSVSHWLAQHSPGHPGRWVDEDDDIPF